MKLEITNPSKTGLFEYFRNDYVFWWSFSISLVGISSFGFASIFGSNVNVPILIILTAISCVIYASTLYFRHKANKNTVYIPKGKYSTQPHCSETKCINFRNECLHHTDNKYQTFFENLLNRMLNNADKLRELRNSLPKDSIAYQQINQAVVGAQLTIWENGLKYLMLEPNLGLNNAHKTDPSEVQKILNEIIEDLEDNLKNLREVVYSARELTLRSIQYTNAPSHMQIILNNFQAVCASFRELPA